MKIFLASLEICKLLVFGHKRQTRYDMIEINKELLDSLFVQAESSDRKRINHDLRTSLMMEDNVCLMLCCAVL